MQFPNADVKDLLGFYERLTSKNLIFDNAIIGNVNLVLSQPVSKEDAVRIIEINLLLNGFTLVPVEGSNIVKVIGIGKNPRSFAIPLITDELLIPDGEHVITFMATLKYADPTEMAQVLGTFIVAGPGGYTNVTPLPKSGAILITENTAIIRQVLRVIHKMDAPPAEVASKFIELERADAEDVQKKLEEILTKQNEQQAPGTAPGSRPVTRSTTTPDGQPITPGAPPEATAQTIEITAGGPNEENIIQGKIKITADKRTNRIHVVTRPANMPFVEKLVRDFDANVKFGEPTVRPLKFVSAADVFQVAVKAISDPGAEDQANATGANGTNRNNTTTNNRSTGSNGSMFGSNSSSGTSGSSGGSSFDFSEGLETDAVDTTPDAVTVGNTRIIADKRANSIIIIGSEDVKEKLFKVIDELDTRQPQVMFHVVIGELNLTDREQFGVDYILKNAGFPSSPIVGGDTPGGGDTPSTGNGLVGFDGAQPVLNLNNLINQNTITQIATGGGSGLAGFFTAGNSLNAIVTALENTNRFRVVSRPSVFTSNLKKAIIASGQEIAVPTQTLTSVTNGSVVNDNAAVSSSIGYKRVALQLEVVPLINADREVDLDILQKNDEVAGSSTIGGNTVPNIATRYVRTHVTVPNRGTVVLGGLIRASTDRTRSGIPLLSRIPLLGYLFSNTTKENIRQELVILIRPEVSWNPTEDIGTRERHQEFFNMPADLESTVYPSLTRSSSRKEPSTRVMIPNPAPLREAATPLPLATPKPKVKPRNEPGTLKKN